MRRWVGMWQMLGFVFVGVLGTLLHFAYDWSGQNAVVGLFSAVNESVWEHTKLLFFPMLAFAAVQYLCMGRDYPNFWCVKALGTAVGLTAIPVLYYTYTGALGINVDWVNIAIFFLAAGVAYWLEAQLLLRGRPRLCIPLPAFAMLALMTLVYIMLTYRPLPIPLFLPPV